ncbi:hypothetical protein KIH39_25260 [Telmatocola sphagniphila]|uniref:Uncharacterized protein n=1 Tax=Telmatocola sphagniphila TaxID=1123043 RepID=A0A8E6B804_9BACT|nr:hypothetical protein [Telmatocola sphagniphila]QVL32105.1 hypothetical protein KIH39_25260 [Telmatocola sphagniphila]
MLENYSPYQQKVIKNYYANIDKVSLQRLSELVTELYLAEGKKKDKLWQTAATTMKKLEVPQSRIDHITSKADVTLLAGVVKELMGK